jgi:hypothetical protein
MTLFIEYPFGNIKKLIFDSRKVVKEENEKSFSILKAFRNLEFKLVDMIRKKEQ